MNNQIIYKIKFALGEKVKTAVYLAKTKDLYDPDLYKKAFEKASFERKKKTEKYKMEEDRIRSLGVEILLQKALEDNGFNAENYEYGYEEKGKPFLKEKEQIVQSEIKEKDHSSQLTINRFHFNLSHSGEYVLCAVSDYEIGCDIEKIGRPDERIARRFYTKEEYEKVFSAPSEEEKNKLFYRYWTLKESFVKCIGEGIALRFNDFSLHMVPDRSFFEKQKTDFEDYVKEKTQKEKTEDIFSSKEKIIISQNVDDRSYYFKEINVLPDYCISICQAEEKCEPELYIISLSECL